MNWDDVSDLGWLNQAPPGEFMLKSAQAAEGIGRNFGQAMNARQQRKQDMDIAKMTDVRAAERNKIEADEAKRRADDEKRKADKDKAEKENKDREEKGVTEGARIAGEITDKKWWDKPEGKKRWFDFIQQYPWMAGTPFGNQVEKNFKDAAGKSAEQITDENYQKDKGELMGIGMPNIDKDKDPETWQMWQDKKNVARIQEIAAGLKVDKYTTGRNSAGVDIPLESVTLPNGKLNEAAVSNILGAKAPKDVPPPGMAPSSAVGKDAQGRTIHYEPPATAKPTAPNQTMDDFVRDAMAKNQTLPAAVAVGRFREQFRQLRTFPNEASARAAGLKKGDQVWFPFKDTKTGKAAPREAVLD